MEDKGDCHHFTSDKARVLAKADLSRKGSVDGPIRDLVEFINTQECYYTTSSCSGRISVFSEGNEQRKKGCRWLLVSHEQIDISQLVSCVDLIQPTADGYRDHTEEPDEYTLFKFEPLILHIMCKSFACAQGMLQVAVGSGFRNSGISCGKKGKILVAVRSSHSLEVPLACKGKLLVSGEYLEHLVKLGNEKMKDNLRRTERFYDDLRCYSESQDRSVKNPKSSKFKTEQVTSKSPPVHHDPQLIPTPPVHHDPQLTPTPPVHHDPQLTTPHPSCSQNI